MPVVSTAKKNSPSKRASRLLTASYLVSSSITPSSVRPAGAPHSRYSDVDQGHTGYRIRPRLASIAARPSAPLRFQSRRISARTRASVLATMRWFSRRSLR